MTSPQLPPHVRRGGTGPVEPGTGWPGDAASRSTPVATTAAEVARLAVSAPTLSHLDARISVCRACPRLVQWREQVSVERRAAYADQRYWGRPVPGFGDAKAKIVVVGLAPAAHGANRTGRMFTGDRSGDVLYAALWRAGLANHETTAHAGDGLELRGVRILSAVRCAPPGNKPTTLERDTCRPWMDTELAMLLQHAECLLVLGGFGWTALWPSLAANGLRPDQRTDFGHGTQVLLPRAGRRPLMVIGCYHVSQQNTFTGRLTPAMLDEVVATAREHAGL